jgi:hypothetical protein
MQKPDASLQIDAPCSDGIELRLKPYRFSLKAGS